MALYHQWVLLIFDNHGYKQKYWEFDFFYNHGYQPLIPGDKGFGATF